MSRGAGQLLAAVLAVLGLVAAGCGDSEAAPSPVADASRVDMCTILSEAELARLGIQPSSRKPVNELGIVGCGWLGDRFTLSLERDQETIAQYVARRNSPFFTSFEKQPVNGRAGVQISVRRDRSDCAQLMDGGSVSLTVAVAQSGLSRGTPFDACAQALRIARMIEPRLPQAET